MNVVIFPKADMPITRTLPTIAPVNMAISSTSARHFYQFLPMHSPFNILYYPAHLLLSLLPSLFCSPSPSNHFTYRDKFHQEAIVRGKAGSVAQKIFNGDVCLGIVSLELRKDFIQPSLKSNFPSSITMPIINAVIALVMEQMRKLVSTSGAVWHSTS